MYQFRLNSDKNELANIIVAEANKLLELSPFLFRSLNDDDSLEEGIKPLSDQEIEHDAYNHLKDGSLPTNLVSFSKSAACAFQYYYPNEGNKTRVAILDTENLPNEIIEAQNITELGDKASLFKNWAISSMEYMVRGNIDPKKTELLYENDFDDLSSYKPVTHEAEMEASDEYTKCMGKFSTYFQIRFGLDSKQAPAAFNFIMGKSHERYNSHDQSVVLKAVLTIIGNDYAVSKPENRPYFKDLYDYLGKYSECRVRYSKIQKLDTSSDSYDDSLYEFTEFFSDLNGFAKDFKKEKDLGNRIKDRIVYSYGDKFTLYKSDKMNNLYRVRNSKGEFSLPFTIDDRKRYNEVLRDEYEELIKCYIRCGKVQNDGAKEYCKQVANTPQWKGFNNKDECNFFKEFINKFSDYCETNNIPNNANAISTISSFLNDFEYKELNGKMFPYTYKGNDNVLKQLSFQNNKLSLPFFCNNITTVKEIRKELKEMSKLYNQRVKEINKLAQSKSTVVARKNSSRMTM